MLFRSKYALTNVYYPFVRKNKNMFKFFLEYLLLHSSRKQLHYQYRINRRIYGGTKHLHFSLQHDENNYFPKPINFLKISFAYKIIIRNHFYVLHDVYYTFIC